MTCPLPQTASQGAILTSWQSLALACAAILVVGAVHAEDATSGQKPALDKPEITTGALAADAAKPNEAYTAALDKKLFAPDGTAELEKSERGALAEFHQTRQGQPLWIADGKLTAKAAAVIAEIGRANDWGLEASDFILPNASSETLAAEAQAEAESTLSLAVLKYARYARGGRIMEPSETLNSNLDRKPQLIEPKIVLAEIAKSDAPDAYLKTLHPKHPQFEKLRQAFLVAAKTPEPRANGKVQKASSLSPLARKLRANMEEWRWMPADMGALHVFNNIPEFMQYVYKDGEIIRSEKIVAGLVDKPSSIFSRSLKHVVLRPMWKVPESMKVNELWPSLLRGGGLMREYGLSLQSKDGKNLDYRQIDWSHADIRNYEVIQPPGGKSVLGVVKFSFPSQHTIYMHDTPDKWMFRPAQRTLSHGCLRVKNPVELAEIILQDDKGWDKAKVAELIRSGPLNNEVAIEKRIPIHLAYFTAWVDNAGKLKTFADVYGHEKRIALALEGRWKEINKGRDHLAPVQPNFDPHAPQAPRIARGRLQQQTVGDFIGNAFGIGF